MLTYHNDLNELTLTKFTPLEINLFFALCKKTAETDSSTITINFDEIKQLANADSYRGSLYFLRLLKGLFKKILAVNVEYGSEESGSFGAYYLFTSFHVDEESKTAIMDANPNKMYILREVVKNFTQIDLIALNNLGSTYSKEAYRRMMQYRNTGKWYISLEDFKRLLDIPMNFNMMRITSNIIDRCLMKELPQYFPNLRINRIKKGRSVVALEFRWDVSNTIDIANTQPVADCPICGHSLYEIPTKDGGSFLGHRESDRKKFECNRTFDNLNHVESERQRIEEKNNAKTANIITSSENLDGQTIDESIIKNQMELLCINNEHLFVQQKFNVKDATIEFKTKYTSDPGPFTISYTEEKLKILLDRICKYNKEDTE